MLARVELRALALQVAACLRKQGLRPGEPPPAAERRRSGRSDWQPAWRPAHARPVDSRACLLCGAVPCTARKVTLLRWCCRSRPPVLTMAVRLLPCIRRRAGDTVAVVLPLTPVSTAVYLGIVLSGCTVVSIADSFAAHEVEARLRIAGAKLAFTQARPRAHAPTLCACALCGAERRTSHSLSSLLLTRSITFHPAWSTQGGVVSVMSRLGRAKWQAAVTSSANALVARCACACRTTSCGAASRCRCCPAWPPRPTPRPPW